MHLIDQIDLVAASDRGIGDILQQLPGLIHLGPGGGIHLQQVDEAPLVDLTAGAAHPTGGGTHPLFTVEGLGEDARQGGLAHPPGTGEEIGVVQAIIVQGVGQRLDHVLLPHQLAERLGTPFARKDLIGHEG